MSRRYILSVHLNKQNAIGRVAYGSIRQIRFLNSVAPVPGRRINTASMVPEQSISAAGEEGEKYGGDDTHANVGTATAGNRPATATEEKKKKKQKKSINLLRGWPSASLLPADALRAASQTALSDPAIWAPGLEYAPDPGYQPLREALARWLGRFYGEHIQATTTPAAGEGEDRDRGDATDRITITGGASQSLACLLQSFTDPARTIAVWAAAPCYFLACPIFADAGFAGRMRAVPEDDEGVDVAALERAMRAAEEKEAEEKKGEGPAAYKDPGPHRKIYRHVVYCVPSFSNPSGRTMTRARREALVRAAREYDALVICDDVYDMLQWRVVGHPSPITPVPPRAALLPRVADLDMAAGRSRHDPPGKRFGHAVSNGSFSKLVAPGARTGWTYSTADFALGASKTGSTRSGGAASQMAATIVCQLLLLLPDAAGGGGDEDECRLDAHIRDTLLPAYARRHGLLMGAIRAELAPLGIRVHEHSLRGREGVHGGYFVWMTLPRGDGDGGKEGRMWPTAHAIAARCRADEDLLIGNGELFAVHGDEEAARFDDAIRLCFAWEDEEALVGGVERLARVIRKMLDEGPGSWEARPVELDDDLDEIK
ncbi:pyridoxal phosphate-dependent transferase [Xylaria palmicola]|nr:pyridoxal phosphate-dependent transferase [Xylaria palmicola]